MGVLLTPAVLVRYQPAGTLAWLGDALACWRYAAPGPCGQHHHYRRSAATWRTEDIPHDDTHSVALKTQSSDRLARRAVQASREGVQHASMLMWVELAPTSAVPPAKPSRQTHGANNCRSTSALPKTTAPAHTPTCSMPEIQCWQVGRPVAWYWHLGVSARSRVRQALAASYFSLISTSPALSSRLNASGRSPSRQGHHRVWVGVRVGFNSQNSALSRSSSAFEASPHSGRAVSERHQRMSSLLCEFS
jgi:hypothetical protein